MNFRYDKTIKYNNSDKTQITANNIDIIQDIISNVFNPITSTFLDNISVNTIKELDTTDNYYKLESNLNRNQIRRINNEIKKELINYSIDILETLQTKNDNFKFIKVLDLACGRGGDLAKFIDTNFKDGILKEKGGVQFILGIDYDPNNIEVYSNRNNINNARARFLEYKNTFLYQNNDDENIPFIYKNNSVYYISGDINKYQSLDDLSIDNIYKLLTNLDNNDFKNRQKYDLKLLNDINNNYDFDLYKKSNLN